MRDVPDSLLAADAAETATLCMCLKITRQDGVVVGATDHDRPFSIDGVAYATGVEFSTLAAAAGLAVDNMECRLLPTAYVTELDLRAGRWNNAAFEIFRVDYTTVDDSPGPDVDVLKRGTTGMVKFALGEFSLEFRGLTQALQRPQGRVTTKICPVRFGSTGNGFCNKDPAPFTFAGVLTSVTDRTLMADAGRGEADDYFSNGIITFTSGANVGLREKVKVFAAGAFTLSKPLPENPEAGDTYSVVAGCDGLLATCRTKFDNVYNFQGMPHLPGADELLKRPWAEAQPDARPNLPE